MEYLLNSTWASDNTQVAAAASVHVAAPADNHQLNQQVTIALPAPARAKHCCKTMDEGWAEIHRDNSQQSAANCTHFPLEFEMTLEEFLIKAGVIEEASLYNRARTPPPQQPSSLLQFSADINSDGNSGHQVTSPAQPGAVEMHMMETGRTTDGKKCPVAEMTMEGLSSIRQKQMIKNHESAARSRARKQAYAYTEELEAELNKLCEENAILREKEE